MSGHIADVAYSYLISVGVEYKLEYQCLLDNYFMYLEYFHYHKSISVPVNCGVRTRLTT